MEILLFAQVRRVQTYLSLVLSLRHTQALLLLLGTLFRFLLIQIKLNLYVKVKKELRLYILTF